MLVNEIFKHTILQFRRKDTNISPQPSFKIVLILIKNVQITLLPGNLAFLLLLHRK